MFVFLMYIETQTLLVVWNFSFTVDNLPTGQQKGKQKDKPISLAMVLAIMNTIDNDAKWMSC